LFRGPQTLATFFRYTDQRCLALYIQEDLRFRAQILQPPTRPDTTQRITTVFDILPPSRCTKRSTGSEISAAALHQTFPPETTFQRVTRTYRPRFRATNNLTVHSVFFVQPRMLGVPDLPRHSRLLDLVHLSSFAPVQDYTTRTRA